MFLALVVSFFFCKMQPVTDDKKFIFSWPTVPLKAFFLPFFLLFFILTYGKTLRCSHLFVSFTQEDCFKHMSEDSSPLPLLGKRMSGPGLLQVLQPGPPKSLKVLLPLQRIWQFKEVRADFFLTRGSGEDCRHVEMRDPFFHFFERVTPV